MLVQQLNFLDGLNVNVSPFLQTENSATVLNGCNVSHKLGAMLKDLGYAAISTVPEANKSILGMHDFHQDPSTQKILVTMNDSGDNDTQLFYKTLAGAWTEIGAAETAWADVANMNVEMETFIGYEFFVGHGTTDGFLPVGSLTGTTFSTVTNVTGMAQGKFIKRYRDRLYVANCRSGGTNYEYRVYYSSVPSAGAITWTAASDFLDVDYGREITGLGTNWDRLVIFTEDRAYLYNQDQFKHVWDVGCSNHRTIQTHGQYMLWTDYDGIWMSTGGQPQNIGGPVIDFIRSGSPRNFFSTMVDEEYRLYVGTVTVNGITYTNCEVTINLATSTYRTREYSDNMTIYGRINDSGTMRQYMGANTGEVFNKGKYTDATLLSSDDGDPIGSNFELAPIHLNSTNLSKRSNDFAAFSDRAQGLNLKARVIDRNARVLTPYKKLGKLTKYVNTFDIDIENGMMLQVAGSEYGTDPYWSFFGYQMDIQPDSELLKK